MYVQGKLGISVSKNSFVLYFSSSIYRVGSSLFQVWSFDQFWYTQRTRSIDPFRHVFHVH
jgi:hypothetical protein